MAPSFNEVLASGKFKLHEKVQVSSNNKIVKILSILNSSGVLMVGNAALKRDGNRSFNLVLDYDPNYLLFTINNVFPYEMENSIANKPVNAWSLINETVSTLKSWGVDESKLSKQLIGQSILMFSIYPDFDKDVFKNVIKNKMSTKNFIDTLRLSEDGLYDEGFAEMSKLPDIFLKEMLSNAEQEDD